MRLLLLLIPLLCACPSTGGEFYEDPDPDPTPTPDNTPGEDSRMGWVQLERAWSSDGPATLSATASFHEPAEYAVWPEDTPGLDECEAGTAEVDDWVIPDSDLDVGTPFLEFTDDDIELNFDGSHWSRQLGVEFWEQHQEFTLRVSGGPDLPAQFFEAVVGTPATLELTDFEEGKDGLTFNWVGGNNDGDIRVLIYLEGQRGDFLYCRFNDDDQQTVAWDTFAALEEADYVVEARRQRSVDFELGEYPGRTLGMSTAITTAFIRSPGR